MSQPREIPIVTVTKKNVTGGGTALIKGTLVKLTATDDGVVAAAAGTDLYFGVVREDIAEQLRLRDPAVLVGNVDRPNLIYRVLPRVNLLDQVAEALGRHEGAAGGQGAAMPAAVAGVLTNYAALAERPGAAATLFECWFTGPAQSLST